MTPNKAIINGFENRLPALETFKPLAPSESEVFGGGEVILLIALANVAPIPAIATILLLAATPPLLGLVNVFDPDSEPLIASDAAPANAAFGFTQSPYVHDGSVHAQAFSV
jgi:hypothetical protein